MCVIPERPLSTELLLLNWRVPSEPALNYDAPAVHVPHPPAHSCGDALLIHQADRDSYFGKACNIFCADRRWQEKLEEVEGLNQQPPCSSPFAK